MIKPNFEINIKPVSNLFHWKDRLLPPSVSFSKNPFSMKNLKMYAALMVSMLLCQAAFAQASLKRANKQYELSVYTDAINSYKDVLRKNPDHKEANVKIADCYRLLNQLENALPHYQSALAQGNVESIYIFQYGLTLQGRIVAFTKNNFTEGVRQIPSSGLQLTLYLAEVNSDGDWTNATPFPHNGTTFSSGYPCFSPDGKALFFASDRPGGYGGFDLYVSYRIGNNWSAPENLGLTVNSLGNEISPFYDGQSLFFSSDFHKGFGGMDIFRAEESNGRWATIFHAGNGLNSSYDDYGFVFDGLRSIGYFVSNRPGGKGNEDIYKVEKELDNVVIKVSDAATGVPIEAASIDFADCDEEVYYTNANGVFNFQMLEDLNCTVYIKKDGFLSEPLKMTSIGIKQSKTLEVQLTNMKNAYQGKTVNASNGYYLDNVKIIATDQGTGINSSSFSDAQGGYFISLKPNASYLLRYSKPGFQDVTLTVKTSANDNRILRNIDLLAVGATGKITTTSEPISFAESPSSAASQPQPAAKKTTTAKTIASGFAVQVAALNNDLSGIGDYKDKLSDLGTVYSVQDGDKIKVRVGVFADRDDAVAMQKLIRAKGFDGAFIVAEKDREVSAANTVNKTAPSAPKTTSTNKDAPLSGYMIRLAAYSNLNYFDKGMVDDLGTPTYMPKGDFTIVLLRGYTRIDDANIALRKVKMRGFPEAYLVDVENGEMKKVQ